MNVVKSERNPFAQPKGFWKVRFSLPASAVEMAQEAFDDITLAVSAFAPPPGEQAWQMELLCDSTPDMTEITRRLLVLSMLHDIPTPTPAMQIVEQKDWVEHVSRGFAPITAGRFFVHGTHFSGEKPLGKTAICVDAGAAFGSGEHATTSGCLEAIDQLSQRRRFMRMLDMGCGSGILAIGMAKVWQKPVLAVDVDPIAVRVAGQNAALNQVSHLVHALESDGYAQEAVQRQAPYDLIVSNILARPLMRFAPDLARALAPDGVAVLSGLLAAQERQVLHAHRAHGLRLQRRIAKDGWHTLILSR